ncbi:hypothetical protein RHMOL_Rhmol02G0301300 [Rhododendron molle]|uniref:Uncharacterized protein n=1 Tax=Rhododendron molle TaxID=49168 RepID=A0ACC0PX57_RHOML|nr:hypothetical protein RHMOL_Rhmol02G0301300 [Rhododendron molle]
MSGPRSEPVLRLIESPGAVHEKAHSEGSFVSPEDIMEEDPIMRNSDISKARKEKAPEQGIVTLYASQNIEHGEAIERVNQLTGKGRLVTDSIQNLGARKYKKKLGGASRRPKQSKNSSVKVQGGSKGGSYNKVFYGPAALYPKPNIVESDRDDHGGSRNLKFGPGWLHTPDASPDLKSLRRRVSSWAAAVAMVDDAGVMDLRAPSSPGRLWGPNWRFLGDCCGGHRRPTRLFWWWGAMAGGAPAEVAVGHLGICPAVWVEPTID